MSDFEDKLSQGFFKSSSEKTYVDKLMARKDVEEVREIIKKERLSREDLVSLLYMLTSVESKLVNLGSWDRYVQLKYFVWIREFVAVAEQLYDYKEDLQKKEERTKDILKKIIVEKKEVSDEELKQIFFITPRSRQMFDNNMRLMEHNVKFLVDLYFNLLRTTLSLGGTGFLEVLKNKYELSYPELRGVNTPLQQGTVSQMRGG